MKIANKKITFDEIDVNILQQNKKTFRLRRGGLFADELIFDAHEGYAVYVGLLIFALYGKHLLARF